MVKTKLRIDGMMCSMCEAHINDAIRNAFDIKKVSSSRKSGITEITSESALDYEKLKSVIEKTGYTLVSCEGIEEVKKKSGLFR